MEPNANRRILSGMRSTNPRLHIGNYEGALRNWVDLQDQGYEMFCMVADLHALTTMYEDAAAVSQNAREVAKDFVAAGINPAKSTVFIQSHVHEHAELHALLSMLTPLSWVERVPTFREQINNVALGGNNLARSVAALSQAVLTVASEAKEAAQIRFRSKYHTSYEPDDPQQVLTQSLKASFKILIPHIADVERYYSDPNYNISDSLKQKLVELTKELWRSELDLHVAISIEGDPIIKVELWAQQLERHRFILEDSLTDLTGVSYGLLGYPILQTADILLYKPYAVPVGRDQAPHLEIGNDIGARFNRLYGREVFPRYRYMIPEDETRAKLPGLDMRKMSKSYDNCIYLSDTEDQTAAKIKSAFTTPTKIKKTDPGIPEGCAVCQYLKLYSPDWESQWQEDREGLRGCMQNKKECTEAVNENLRPIRERRASISDADIEEILRLGAERAREVAGATMTEVRDAMGMH